MSKPKTSPEQTRRNIAAFERGKAAGLSEDEPIDPHFVEGKYQKF
jgi:hypothetical protein